MPGLALAAARPLPNSWPSTAPFGIDFRTGRAARSGTYCPLGETMTFARPSPRLVRTGSGAWRAVAANQPALTDLGLSIEPERTNIILNNTGDGGAGILLTGATLAASGGTNSPANDDHAKRLSHGSGTTDGLSRHSLAVAAGQLYSWSQSFKYDGSATWIRFTFSDNVAHGLNAWLNLESMTLGTTGVFGSAQLQAASLLAETGGWHRLTLSGSLPSAATGSLSTYATTGDASATRKAGSLLLWGTQMEAGEATSPILTSGSAILRQADVCSLNLAAGAQLLHVNDQTGVSSRPVANGLHQLAAGVVERVWTTAN